MSGPGVRPWRQWPAAVWIGLLALGLALGLLGGRGIWDPDEGRYTNVALNMLDSGDWVTPRRSDDVGHWTKPPLTYWAIASSIAVFGPTPWAARLPSALSFLLCTWLAWRTARRLRPGSEDQAALVYATMLFTVGAAHLITTDYLLAACSGVAMWAFVEARFGALRPRAWIAVSWAGFALAFLTKGPPGLLPMLAIVAFDLARPGRSNARFLQLPGVALFLLLALPWYLAVIVRNPGLLDYFVGKEVIDRVATNSFGRHGQWYGWLSVYAPTLLVGTLPWTPALLRWARALPARVRAWWRSPQRRLEDAAWLLPTLWLLLPLLVFCLSRSRLPLYLLPLFLPLAVLAAMQRHGEGRPLPRRPWLAAWAVLLLALQAAAAHWPTHKDASEWARAIRTQAGGPVREVLFVDDMVRYGVHLHLGTATRVEKIGLDPLPQSRFSQVYDELLTQELAEPEPGRVWITKQARWPEVARRIALAGQRAVVIGQHRDRVLFRVEAAPRD